MLFTWPIETARGVEIAVLDSDETEFRRGRLLADVSGWSGRTIAARFRAPIDCGAKKTRRLYVVYSVSQAINLTVTARGTIANKTAETVGVEKLATRAFKVSEIVRFFDVA